MSSRHRSAAEQEGYFDKGHSNYNSVAQFFGPALAVDMLDNVLYERKNLLYEDLLEMVSWPRVSPPCATAMRDRHA